MTVASPAMTEGYGDLPELNAVAFRGGRYFTGDLGRIDDDGMLYLEGRKKLLIETGGFKVDPIEVEAVLNAHPAVTESVVVGVDTEVAGEQRVKARRRRAAASPTSASWSSSAASAWPTSRSRRKSNSATRSRRARSARSCGNTSSEERAAS